MNKNDFKDAGEAAFSLESALKMERDKYANCPVKNDLISEYIYTQAWGYVVAGYFLLEQSLKLLLRVRNKPHGPIHTLWDGLFSKLPEDDKNVLREYYRDFRSVFKNAKTFPFLELDDFLKNLDGGKNDKDKHVGSLDWRYFPVEKAQERRIPTVSIEFLHEIIYATIRVIGYGEAAGNFDPSKGTYSWRKHNERRKKYEDWQTVMMNVDGWKLCDRLELLWGPDYRDRYDYFILKGGQPTPFFFAEIPANHNLRVKDRRDEIKAFDVSKGYASIEVQLDVEEALRLRR